MNLRNQLEEIQILQCSLIPPEIFAFVLPQRDNEEWTKLLQDFIEEGRIPDGGWQPASTCRFEVRVQGVQVWFEVELPRKYPDSTEPIIYVRGTNIQRVEQENWRAIVEERLSALKEEGAEFLVQTLLCLHLIPLLHEQVQALQSASPASPSLKSTNPASSETYHVLFTSHHLVSPTKRRNLQKWSSELCLRGFAKVGYPGAIYAEGSQADIAEFVTRVKAMQWLALKVRFEERLSTDKYGKLRLGEGGQNIDEAKERGGGKWIELEKVGEIVDLMRRSGREEFVTEMGLGSSGNASTPRT